MSHFAHSGLHIHQHNCVTRAGLLVVLSVTVPVTVAACASAAEASRLRANVRRENTVDLMVVRTS